MAMAGSVASEQGVGGRALPTIAPSFDRFGRRIDYLRISLTDRCNLRCVYCMPATGMHFAPRDELLSDEEFLRVIRLTTEIGFRKFRLTGGEPTVRPHLPELIGAIKALPGVAEVAMTTNALLLPKLVPAPRPTATPPSRSSPRCRPRRRVDSPTSPRLLPSLCPLPTPSLSRRAPRSALMMRGQSHLIRSRLVPAHGGGGRSGFRGLRRSHDSALTAAQGRTLSR